MKLEFSEQIFEKYSDANSLENPSSGSRVVPCGQTDMTKLIVAFRNFLRTRLKSRIKWDDNEKRIINLILKMTTCL
jgi:hypothetical protein